MPNYYNQYSPYGYNPMPNTWSGAQPAVGTQYMINVDGEVGAKAWQMPANLPPNTVVPLFDLDGQHVYFRSVDAYGRMNPLRKGRVVFDDEQVNLPQGSSGETKPVAEEVHHEDYVTREELKELKDGFRELKQMMQQNMNGNQNGRQNRGGRNE